MAELLKNVYNEAYFALFITNFKAAYPAFDADLFLKHLYQDDWDDLSIKARMRRITESVQESLQLPFPEAVAILQKAAPVGNGLADMLFPDFVAKYGLEDLERSLNALEYLTEFSSSEFAIRPFIMKYEEETMARMRAWSTHENHHVRRLASEGCRWRLPWAMSLPKFKEEPKHVLPILEQLRADDSLYVRKSVANNLNDISHNFPNLVLDIAERWQKEDNPHTNWIIKRACRTLLKAGNLRAMRLFGFGDPADISVSNLQTKESSIAIGEEVHFSFVVNNEAKKATLLRLEYGIDYVKKSGKSSRKVFSISENTYPTDETAIQRKQSFRNMTTRKHYAGTHYLAILVNGIEKATIAFEVV